MQIRWARAWRRVATTGILAAAGFVAVPGSALADTSSLTYVGNGSGGSLTLAGDASNNTYTLTATTSGSTITSIAIADSADVISSPGGICSATSKTVTCTADGSHAVTSIAVMGSDGSDRLGTVGVPANFPIAFNGGNGDDRLDADPGVDSFNGGPGYDLASYDALAGPVKVSADGLANDGEAGETDNVGTDVEEIFGSDGADTLTATSTPSSDAADRVALYGNAGADTLNGGTTGDDLAGGPDDDVLNGGGGEDELEGDHGNDVLNGGGGDDQLDPDPGADSIHGGADFDIVNYGGEPFAGPAPGSGVKVSLDDVANDGEVGQDGAGVDGAGAAGDNVHADVEQIDGSAGNDTLTGDAAANLLFGISGDDTLTGGGGADFLFAGDGNDTLQATDNTADLVDCGPGADTATTDDIDSASECEANSVTPATLPVIQVPVNGTTPAPLPTGRRAAAIKKCKKQHGKKRKKCRKRAKRLPV